MRLIVESESDDRISGPKDADVHYARSLRSPERDAFFKNYPIGLSWTITLEIILKDLIRADLGPQAKILELQKTLLYSIEQNEERVKDLAFQEWDKYFQLKGFPLERLPPNLQESEYHSPQKIITTGRGRYSLDFFSRLNLTLDIRTTLGETFERGCSLIEIGGGYGQLARMVKLLSPASRYLMLDLPESLYFAALYLSLNFPNHVVRWAGDAHSLERHLVSGDYDFLLVPCYLAPALAARAACFDGAINKSSFGEMNNKTSAYYIDLVQRQLKVQHVFFQNRLLNPVDPLVQRYRMNENQWFDNLDDRWEALDWEVEPAFTRFSYNEILHHRELYFIGRRCQEPQTPRPIDDIYLQKWYTNFTIVPFARHSKMLAADLAKGSTLERLVNFVRSRRDPKAIDALIKYIYLLEGKFPFEERFYYSRLYRKLAGKRHPLAAANPQGSLFLLRFFLKVIGVSFVLKHPAIPKAIIQLLRAVGLDVRWTYRFLKKILLREN